jgi:hypothetical protein
MKYILFALLLVLLVGNVLAADSLKQYDPVAQEITFKNSILGMPTSDIATAKLLTPHINFVTAGTDVKIAEIEINSFEEYSNFLSGIDFYNNKTGTKLTRNFHYRYRTYENYDEDVPIYKEVTDKNGTTYNDIVGYEKQTKQRAVWNNFDKLDIKTEKIVVGVFTDLKVGDKIEWIPTMFGLKVSEWAIVIETNLHAQAYTGTDLTDSYLEMGARILTDTNLSLVTIIKDSTSGATQGCIKMYNDTVMGCAQFVGDEANFTTAINITAGKQYVVYANRTTYPGSWNVARTNVLAGFPYVVANISWLKGYDSTSGGTGYNSTRMWNVAGIRYYYQPPAPTALDAVQSYPATGFTTLNYTVTLACNFSATAQNITSVKLLVYAGNGSIYYSNTTTTNTLSYNITWMRNFTDNTYNWSCHATGNLGINDSTENRSITITRVIETGAMMFNATTYESSLEGYYFNIVYDNSYYLGITANLIYNGTSYTSIKSGTGSNVTFTKSNLVIPTVAVSGTNLSFYWYVTLINGTGSYYLNSTSRQQKVFKGTPLTVNYSCGTGFSPAFNFTFYYEQNLSKVNATTINYYLTYGFSGNNTANNISGSFSNVDSFRICLNNSQSYYDVGYGEIQYSVAGSVDRRYYVFGGTRLTNTTVDIPIYALEVSPIATSFLMTAQTTSLVPYIGYYIGLLRWYPSSNSYKTVDMGKTDDKGQTVLRIKTEDVDYKFALYDTNGNLIQLSNSVRLICQTNPCVYTLYINPTPLSLSTFTNIQSSLTFNSTTKVFTFIWNDPSQATQTINLTVYKETGTSSELVCSSTSTGYTGIVICDVSAYSGNLRATATRTASPETYLKELSVWIRDTFITAGGGTLGLLLGAILLIVFAFVGIASPVLVIILAVVSLIPMVILGNISMGVFAAIGVVAGVILHVIGRTK